MDFTFEDALKSGGASATILAIAGIGYKLLSMFCGKRVRSECCGHEATAAISVEVVQSPPPAPVEAQSVQRTPRPSVEKRSPVIRVSEASHHEIPSLDLESRVPTDQLART